MAFRCCFNFFALFFKTIFMCMSVLSASMCVHHVCAWCLWSLEEDVTSSGSGGLDSSDPVWVLRMNQDLLQE